jgi:hypothetical protein
MAASNGRRVVSAVAAGGLAAALAGGAGATPVDSRDFFSPFSPTLTTWEVRGNGAPITLLEGGTMALPAGEYASSGFTFSQDIAWVNDGSATFNAAQALAGSPEIAIPSAAFNSFDILFTVPTDAFGFVVINNSGASAPPAFTAFNALNQPIETVTWGAAFIDGTVGNAEYGFMGISSPADKIARVSVTKQAAILDDFLFATIPGPGAAAVLAAGLICAGRRRR